MLSHWDTEMDMKPRTMAKNDEYITNTNFYTVHKESYHTHHLTEVPSMPLPLKLPLYSSKSTRTKKLRSCTPLKDIKKPSLIQSLAPNNSVASLSKMCQAQQTIKRNILVTPFKLSEPQSHMISSASHPSLGQNQAMTQRNFKETITPLQRNMQISKLLGNSTTITLPPVQPKLSEVLQEKPEKLQQRKSTHIRKKSYEDGLKTHDEYYEAIKRIWAKHNVKGSAYNNYRYQKKVLSQGK